MKAIIIVEVDPEVVLDAAYGTDIPEDATVEGATEGELNWAQQSGIGVIEVIMDDSFSSNDQDLGAQIRKYLK